MPIVIVTMYTRQLVRLHPDTLFVFGDNMVGRGFAGQARACRGEPNAVGIPTKWYPAMDPRAFFTDDDLPKVKSTIDARFLRCVDHLRTGGIVACPPEIGTGLAQLPTRAPRIYTYITRCLMRLNTIATGGTAHE